MSDSLSAPITLDGQVHQRRPIFAVPLTAAELLAKGPHLTWDFGDFFTETPPIPSAGLTNMRVVTRDRKIVVYCAKGTPKVLSRPTQKQLFELLIDPELFAGT